MIAETTKKKERAVDCKAFKEEETNKHRAIILFISFVDSFVRRTFCLSVLSFILLTAFCPPCIVSEAFDSQIGLSHIDCFAVQLCKIDSFLHSTLVQLAHTVRLQIQKMVQDEHKDVAGWNLLQFSIVCFYIFFSSFFSVKMECVEELGPLPSMSVCLAALLTVSVCFSFF